MDNALVSLGVALITGVCSLLGVYFANRKSQGLIAYRLEELERKVDRHNKLIERTYKLEGEMVEVQHDIRDLKTNLKTKTA